jgi:hypothetical protein
VINGYSTRVDFDHLIDLANSHLTMMKLAPSVRYKNSGITYSSGALASIDELIEIDLAVRNGYGGYEIWFRYELSFIHDIYLIVEDRIGKMPRLKVELSSQAYYKILKQDMRSKFVEATGSHWQYVERGDKMCLAVGDGKYVMVVDAFRDVVKALDAWEYDKLA